MGKKDKKKGKGAEKTAAKTDKKLSLKMKKELAVKGEVRIRTRKSCTTNTFFKSLKVTVIILL